MEQTTIEDDQRGPRRTMPLSSAIRSYVHAGMHLHFASTPSRSNAAIRELARQFANKNPRFVVSTTGMHSAAHLLARLRLGQRYISCFFGDNYPTPRPNPLYQEMEAEGHTLEHWSLSTFVSAFRAGARGEPYAVTTSLRGTDLGALLAREGQYFEVKDPLGEGQLSLIRAKRADIVFLHAGVADEDGNALFCPPYCEGFHAALGARRGVIVTAESIVPRGELRQFPQFVPLPAHRVLAICQVRCGAHPQPLHILPEQYRAFAYPDDTAQYLLWRRIALEPELFERFCCDVLAHDENSAAYRDFVVTHGSDWVESLPASDGAPSGAVLWPTNLDATTAVRNPGNGLEQARGNNPEPSNSAWTESPRPSESRREYDSEQISGWSSCSRDMRTTLLAARSIVRRVAEHRFDVMLAGIGQSFAAARLAMLLLADLGHAPELVVETGLSGFDPILADPFLLGYRNIVGSRRLSDVEHILGALVCGNGARCLAVIGAAQIDSAGHINSTRTKGTLLVGSGGANDIASAVDEVTVVVRAQAERLPQRVEFITSPGARVRSIVSDAWEIGRTHEQEPWTLRQWIASDNESRSVWVPDWCLADHSDWSRALPPTERELEGLLAIARRPLASDTLIRM